MNYRLKKEPVLDGTLLQRRPNAGALNPPTRSADLSRLELERMVHELQVQRMELEIQNEVLRETQLELELSKQQLSDLYDFAPVAYLGLDQAGIILTVNLTGANLLQAERQLLLGQPFTRFVTRDAQDELYFYRRRLLEAECTQACELKMVTWNGKEFYAQLESSVVLNVYGEFDHWRTTISDVTQRKTAEQKVVDYQAEIKALMESWTAALVAANQELTEANQTKDKFMDCINHELRTPLTTILLKTQSLQRGRMGKLEESQLDALETIEQNAHHLQTLIGSILDFRQMDETNFMHNRRVVQLRMICEASLDAMRQLAKRNLVNLQLRYECTTAFLYSHEHSIEQILIYLLHNAIKFTPEGGTVGLVVTDATINGTRNEKSVCLSVWDTGIGIPEDKLKFVLSPFAQVDDGLTRTYEGVGMGLALVERLVQLHGGNIQITSEIGQGSQFRVILPC